MMKKVSQIIMQIFGIDNGEEISTFFRNRTKEELRKDVEKIRKIKGTNKTQIARIIRMSRWIMQKVWEK